MSNDGIVELPEAGKFEDALTGILRNGARRLLHTAVEPEPDGFPDSTGTAVPVRAHSLAARVPWLYLKGIGTSGMSGLPGVQDRQRARRRAEGHPARGEVGTAAGPDGGDPGRCRPGLRPFPCRPSGQASEGHTEAGRGPRGTDGLPRLPGRALAGHPHHQPGRVGPCHDPPRDPGNAGLPEPNHHALHDVQARSACRNPVAQTVRVPAARPGYRGRVV